MLVINIIGQHFFPGDWVAFIRGTRLIKKQLNHWLISVDTNNYSSALMHVSLQPCSSSMCSCISLAANMQPLLDPLCFHKRCIFRLLNELKENSLNQKSKSRLSLEIIQHKSAPLLPAVAMEISPTIFGWIQHSSWGDMWRMRMCLCEWLCVHAWVRLYVCVLLSETCRLVCVADGHIESDINYIRHC